jgi:hypothetical protein
MFQSGLISNVMLVQKLWEFLGNREVALTNHPSTFKLNSLAITVFSGPAQEQALKLIQNLADGETTQVNPFTPSESNTSDSESSSQASFDKSADHVAMRFK